jgi:hypothetical protein
MVRRDAEGRRKLVRGVPKTLQGRFNPSGTIRQHHAEQRAVDFKIAVIVIKPSLRNLFIKWLTRERVVPIISASVYWLTFAISGSDRTSFPKLAMSSRSLASLFSVELKI